MARADAAQYVDPMLRYLVVFVFACSTPAPRPVEPVPVEAPAPVEPTAPVEAPPAEPRAPTPLAIAEDRALPATSRPQASARVTIKASGAASRQDERPRVLAKLVADRGGRVELVAGYTRVGLQVTEIVAGTLDDPDYAKRPVGSNHLSVVLLDEAAFAASDGLDGFAGTWTLTRTVDGTLVVSAIQDTPFPPAAVAPRAALIKQLRAGLRSPKPDDRLAALEGMRTHAFYELAPDVIPLLDDPREAGTPQPPPGRRGMGIRKVSATAYGVLVALARPFADDRTPTTPDRQAWQTFWAALLVPDTTPRRELPGTPAVIATIPMNQSWPQLVGLPDGGFALGIDRMQRPLDGHVEGIALTRAPYTSRTWISPRAGEAFDVARGSDGTTALLHVDPRDAWRLALVPPNGAPKLVDLGFAGSHAALAAGPNGYAIAYVKGGTDRLYLVELDRAGRAKPPREVALPARTEGNYHHGVFPVGLARRPNGWFAVVETAQANLLVVLDDQLRLVGTPLELAAARMAQVKVAVGKRRALLAWTHEAPDRAGKLGYLAVDLDGRPVGPPGTTGFDVDLVARPVALDDGGFAVAWTAGEEEVHVGRWDATGAPAGSALAAPRGAIYFGLALARDGKDVIVGWEDVSRYPYTLRALRVDPATL